MCFDFYLPNVYWSHYTGLKSSECCWYLLLEESPVLKVQKAFMLPFSSFRMDLSVLVFWLCGKEVVWHLEFLGRDAKAKSLLSGAAVDWSKQHSKYLLASKYRLSVFLSPLLPHFARRSIPSPAFAVSTYRLPPRLLPTCSGHFIARVLPFCTPLWDPVQLTELAGR